MAVATTESSHPPERTVPLAERLLPVQARWEVQGRGLAAVSAPVAIEVPPGAHVLGVSRQRQEAGFCPEERAPFCLRRAFLEKSGFVGCGSRVTHQGLPGPAAVVTPLPWIARFSFANRQLYSGYLLPEAVQRATSLAACVELVPEDGERSDTEEVAHLER